MNIKRELGWVAGIVLIGTGIFLLFYKPGGVIVSWETASEVDTMGFHLYRAQGSAEATFAQINAKLIPAKGDPLTGAAYEVKDEDVEPGRLYFYQIEEVEWNGSRNRYPELVQARAGVPRLWFIAEGAVLIFLGGALVYLQTCLRSRSIQERLTGQDQAP